MFTYKSITNHDVGQFTYIVGMDLSIWFCLLVLLKQFCGFSTETGSSLLGRLLQITGLEDMIELEMYSRFCSFRKIFNLK